MENGEQKTCQVEMHDDKPCGRPLYDGEKCICHSEKEDKDVKLFQRELDKIFGDEKAEYYDLTRFIFPKEGYTLPKEYKKDTYFTSATFSGAADFRWARFSGEANFIWATFSGKAYFVDARFSGQADFNGATFSGNAHFGGATFSGIAGFFSTAFSGEAAFRKAMFSGVVYFREATFSGDADFLQATFSSDAYFISAKFSGITRFQSTLFETLVSFSYCEACKGSVITFDGEELQKKKKEMFSVGANFIGCSFAEAKNVKFRKVSLVKCRFLETDVTEVQFIEVAWAGKPKLLKRYPRAAVFDELSPDVEWLVGEGSKGSTQEIEPLKFQYRLIAQLYRRLQANYVNNYRYSEAGDFYIGEQEMVRKAKGKVGQYLSTNNAYRIISYYGESFLLPLLWMLVVLLAIPAVLLYDGINLNPTLQDPVVAETVNYEWSWSPGDFLPAKSDYWEAFVANFSLIAYSRSDISKYLPESHTRFIVTIESLIVIALLAFFLLALRRQYKRKTF